MTLISNWRETKEKLHHLQSISQKGKQLKGRLWIMSGFGCFVCRAAGIPVTWSRGIASCCLCSFCSYPFLLSIVPVWLHFQIAVLFRESYLLLIIHQLFPHGLALLLFSCLKRGFLLCSVFFLGHFFVTEYTLVWLQANVSSLPLQFGWTLTCSERSRRSLTLAFRTSACSSCAELSVGLEKTKH